MVDLRNNGLVIKWDLLQGTGTFILGQTTENYFRQAVYFMKLKWLFSRHQSRKIMLTK